MTGTEVLARLGTLLKDPDETVWFAATKAEFVDEAIRAIALLRPDAAAVTETMTLGGNKPQKTIPEGGYRFLDIISNTGGKAVREIPRSILSDMRPDWTIPTEVSEIDFYMFDLETPTTFYVYPVPASNIDIELIYAKSPAEFTSESTSLGLDDTFLPPVMEYAMYRCFTMNSKRMDLARGNTHLNTFYKLLGAKAQNDMILQQVQEAK